MHGHRMLTKKIVANVATFQASFSLGSVVVLRELRRRVLVVTELVFACASGSDPALFSGRVCLWLTQFHLDYKVENDLDFQ